MDDDLLGMLLMRRMIIELIESEAVTERLPELYSDLITINAWLTDRRARGFREERPNTGEHVRPEVQYHEGPAS